MGARYSDRWQKFTVLAQNVSYARLRHIEFVDETMNDRSVCQKPRGHKGTWLIQNGPVLFSTEPTREHFETHVSEAKPK